MGVSVRARMHGTVHALAL